MSNGDSPHVPYKYKISNTEIQEIVDKYTDMYPDMAKYKHKFISFSQIDAKLIANKYKAEIVDIIKRKDSEELTPISFICKNDDFFALSIYFPFADDSQLLIILYNDETIIMDIFKEAEPYYPKGVYHLKKCQFGIYLSPLELSSEDGPILNNGETEKIQQDIDTFFDKQDFYKENKLSYKRGIILYGPPGNGKTSLIREILRNNPDKFGILVDTKSDMFNDIPGFLKRVLDDKQKIIVFEDIDGVDTYNRSSYLNFLDGVTSVQNSVIIATTNYLEKVDAALINRPSRFDRAYNVGFPNLDVRKLLLKRFFPRLTVAELSKHGLATNGFSGAYFKELFIFQELRGCSLEEAIKEIKEQLKTYGQCKGAKDYFG